MSKTTTAAARIDALEAHIQALEARIEALSTPRVAPCSQPQRPPLENKPYVGIGYRTKPNGSKQKGTHGFDSQAELYAWARTVDDFWSHVYLHAKDQRGQLHLLAARRWGRWSGMPMTRAPSAEVAPPSAEVAAPSTEVAAPVADNIPF